MIIRNPKKIHSTDDIMNVISIRVNDGLSIIVIVMEYRSAAHENHSPHMAAGVETLYIQYLYVDI